MGFFVPIYLIVPRARQTFPNRTHIDFDPGSESAGPVEFVRHQTTSDTYLRRPGQFEAETATEASDEHINSVKKKIN